MPLPAQNCCAEQARFQRTDSAYSLEEMRKDQNTMSIEALQEQQKSWTQTPPVTPPLRHIIAQVAERQTWLDRLAQPFQRWVLQLFGQPGEPLLQTLLGLRADAPHRRLYVNPTLPAWLPDLQLQHLHVGPCWCTLHFWREGDRSRWEVTEMMVDQGAAQEDRIQVMNEPEGPSSYG